MPGDPFTLEGKEDRMKTKILRMTGSPSRDLTKLGWRYQRLGQEAAALSCFLAVLSMRRAPKSHVASARRGLFAVKSAGW
jgi:hypothetical protein